VERCHHGTAAAAAAATLPSSSRLTCIATSSVSVVSRFHQPLRPRLYVIVDSCRVSGISVLSVEACVLKTPTLTRICRCKTGKIKRCTSQRRHGTIISCRADQYTAVFDNLLKLCGMAPKRKKKQFGD